MSNTLLTISMITRESLRILRNQLAFAKGANRQYDDQFARSGAKIGSVINIRKPVRFQTVTGPALQIQDVTDQYSALTLGTQAHVDFQFLSKDLTLSIDEFAARYLAPATNALANKVDFDGLTLGTNTIWNAVGTPATPPATALVALQAMQKLDENAAPRDANRYIVINPQASASMVDALKGLFQSSEKIAEQYDSGMMGMALGASWRMDQNIQTHTVGALGGTGVTACATAQTGANIVTNNWTASVANLLLAGDIITFAGLYACNPVSFQSTGSLKQFIVTSNVSSLVGGTATIPISPAITASGPFQNVSSSSGGQGSVSGVAATSTIVVLGTAAAVSPCNLAYHKDAFVLGCADLELPGGVEMSDRAADPQTGLSIRIVRAYDIVNDQHPCRLDILYGWSAVYPELACRIQG